MYLEKLEIHGFKSFAHKTILTFPAYAKAMAGKPAAPKTVSSITAIVGPNGSGKSNLAEAVRWVLGEQSLKALRGKKSEDVIFSGSSKKARLGFAEVALHLNNRDDKVKIDYQELAVARRLFRDGTSDYLLNGSRVRLTDVQLLLAQANFGQRTYSVIGQGTVDAILAASPYERKEFFDEATGVKQYQIKREQALHKITATEENLAQAAALLREITPRLRQLERQAKRLAERGAIEQKLRQLQRQHYGRLWQSAEQERQRLLSEKEKRAQTEAGLKGKAAELQTKLEGLEQKKTAGQEYENLQRAYQEALNQKSELAGELKGLERELRLERERAAPAPNIADHQELAAAAEQTLNFLRRLLAARTANELAAVRVEAKKLHAEISALLHKNKVRGQTENKPAPQKLTSQLAVLQTKLEQATKTAQAAAAALTRLRQEEQSATASLFSRQREYHSLQQELSAASREKNQIEIELARVETRREDLTEEISKEVPSELQSAVKSAPAIRAAEDLWPQIARAKQELEMIGGIEPEAASEYAAARERHDFLSRQTADLQTALKKTKQVEQELSRLIDKEFTAGFAKIITGFQEYFAALFDGGQAALELKKENELEILNEEIAGALTAEERAALERRFKIGIEIRAAPPHKKVSNINLLSGGERALTSIALICAIIRANPSPFVVLDEVDAALDEANSQRFAAILEKLSRYTQFIVITHNRATMEKASILYGVTMGDDGVSKLLSIDLEKAVKTIR